MRRNPRARKKGPAAARLDIDPNQSAEELEDELDEKIEKLYEILPINRNAFDYTGQTFWLGEMGSYYVHPLATDVHRDDAKKMVRLMHEELLEAKNLLTLLTHKGWSYPDDEEAIVEAEAYIASYKHQHNL